LAAESTSPASNTSVQTLRPDRDDVVEYDAEVDENRADAPPRKRAISAERVALMAAVSVLVALGGLVGWLGFRAQESHRAEVQRGLFLEVARQGALNLTTISFAEADSDIQRILDSATGKFHDDFSKRSRPFVDVVKQAQSKSVGTVTEAALESESDNDAQVVVAVSVKTSTAAAPDGPPRRWRMRISVQKVADGVKVSDVQFVP